jgi:polyferredoxin
MVMIVLTGSFLSTQSMGYLFMGRPQPLNIALYFYLLLGFFVITGPLFGRAYCGYMCPLGFIQELIYSIRPSSKKIPEKWSSVAGSLKYFILIAVILVMLYTNSVDPAFYEPFSIFNFTTPALIVVISLILVVIASIFFPFFYCRYLCGVGALSSSFSIITMMGLLIDENCDECGDCIGVCPTGAISDNYQIDNSVCILCGRCVNECSGNNIKSGFKK